MRWQDTYDIALALYEAHPDIRPLELRFTDLHHMVCQLPNFQDDPLASNEKILESIQMYWLEECED